MSDEDLCFALCRFVVEVRKVDGSLYPPKTVRQLVLLIQMYLNNNGRSVRFLGDNEFLSVQNAVDNVMKRGAEHGLGLNVKQAKVISVQQEDILWEKGLLGSHSPKVLLDTMVFLIGLQFALRSGDEHRNLSRDQLQVHTSDNRRY
jgi:hypothetical protein